MGKIFFSPCMVSDGLRFGVCFCLFFFSLLGSLLDVVNIHLIKRSFVWRCKRKSNDHLVEKPYTYSLHCGVEFE